MNVTSSINKWQSYAAVVDLLQQHTSIYSHFQRFQKTCPRYLYELSMLFQHWLYYKVLDMHWCILKSSDSSNSVNNNFETASV